MIITTSDNDTKLEVSHATGKAIVNLNRDNLTRTLDAIDYGVEINDAIRNRPAGVSIIAMCKSEFGICYAQACKYRKLAYAAYNPKLQDIVTSAAIGGMEYAYERIAGRVNLRYCD